MRENDLNQEEYVLIFTDEAENQEKLTSFLTHLKEIPEPKQIIRIPTITVHEYERFFTEFDYCRTNYPQPYSVSYNSIFPHQLKAYLSHFYNFIDKRHWLKILENLLLENPVIVFSKSLKRISYTVMACLLITMPLTWCHSIFSILPESTLDFLQCPTPYIAGIHRSLIEIAKHLLPSNVILIDLDEQKLFTSELADDTLFPESFLRWTETVLQSKREPNKLDMEKEITLSCVRQPIMRVTAALLHSYEVAFTLDEYSNEYKFNTGAFVNRFKKMARFNEALVKTSMLQEFITNRLSILNEKRRTSTDKLGKYQDPDPTFQEAIEKVDYYNPLTNEIPKSRPDKYKISNLISKLGVQRGLKREIRARSKSTSNFFPEAPRNPIAIVETPKCDSSKAESDACNLNTERNEKEPDTLYDAVDFDTRKMSVDRAILANNQEKRPPLFDPLPPPREPNFKQSSAANRRLPPRPKTDDLLMMRNESDECGVAPIQVTGSEPMKPLPRPLPKRE